MSSTPYRLIHELREVASLINGTEEYALTNGKLLRLAADELEQAQDKLAEYGEEIARLREALMPFAQHYADWSDFSYDEPLVEGTWSGGPENATFLTVGHLKAAMEAMR